MDKVNQPRTNTSHIDATLHHFHSIEDETEGKRREEQLTLQINAIEQKFCRSGAM